MKICLIRPAILVPRRNQTAMFTPPLGLAYVAGALRAAGHEVTAIDAVGASMDTRHDWRNDCHIFGLSPERTIERVPADVGLIGVQAGFSFEWPYTRELIQGLRAQFPDAWLVGGGEHLTAMPEDSLVESGLDLGVLGEAEETVVELASALERGDCDLATVGGIAWRDALGAVHTNPRRARARDIDSLPLPAWDLFPIEAYLDGGHGFGVNRGRSMPVMASRGCPYQCTFCSSPLMWTTKWVARDPDLLLDELALYQERYGAENFDFYDLTAIIKKQWIVRFCQRIQERGMAFTWQLPSGTRSEVIDAEVAGLLYQTGCRNLSYSPESGSIATLRAIKKKIHPETMLDSIASCVDIGLNIKTNIILGFPNETYREVLESYRFIAKMGWRGAHDISVWGFSPYPGSELFNELRAAGKLTVDDAFYDGLRSYADASRTVSWSPAFSDRRLKTLRLIGAVIFYAAAWLRRPFRPFRMVWNVVRGTHESRSEMAVANLLRRRRIAAVEA